MTNMDNITRDHSPVMADKAAHFDRVGANQSALPLLL